MRIGIWMYSYLPKIGGAQISAHSLANSLAAQGHHVVVYADSGLLEQCSDLGWRFRYETRGISRTPFRLAGHGGVVGAWLGARSLVSAVKADRLDVVQVVGMWPWSLILGKVRAATHVIFAVRAAGDDIQVDEDLQYGVGLRRHIRVQIAEALCEADLGVAISPTVADEFAALGMPEDRIRMIPPGVDFEAFQNCESDSRTTRERWGLPIDRKLIISVGRYHAKKGLEDLVRALPVLNRDGGQFALAIIGRDSGRLDKTARQAEVSEAFFPLPIVASDPEPFGGTFPSSELIDLYRSADCFVLPSYLETYANVALEAMAAGTPVIVTDVPGCRDTVVDGVDGLLVPTHSPESIANAVERIAFEPELRSQLVEGGLAKARSQGWSAIAARYAVEYERMRGGKGQSWRT